MNMVNEFNEKMQDYNSYTEANMRRYNNYTYENRPQRNLLDAMNYSLEAGGKRIRPILVYAFCEALGGDFRRAAAPACAVEMMHTFSLIHDDLPAMDDDDLRRGKPSCHKKFSEAMAILAGDALSVLPFEILADDELLTAEQKILMISVLANAVGRDGMIGGQVIDMENAERDDVDEDNLRNMYKCKTGQLIAVSCAMGGKCADADMDKIREAIEYGYKLGLAFQIVDDILDVTGDEEVIGKPVGSDEAEHKTTFVSLYGVEKAQEIADRITDEALEILDNFDNNEFLRELTIRLLNRKK